MAIEVVFEVGGPATAGQVGDVLARTAAEHKLVVTAGTRFERPGADLRSGLHVSCSTPSPLPFPHPVEEVFGFAPAVHVLFRFSRGVDPTEQDQDLVRLVAAVLTAVPGDAWLAYAGETTWLLRRDGELTLSDDDRKWTPEEALLLPPHVRAPLPSM